MVIFSNSWTRFSLIRIWGALVQMHHHLPILILNTCPQCNQNIPPSLPNYWSIPAKAVDKESNGKGSNHTTNGKDGHWQGPEGCEKHISGRVFWLLFRSVIDKVLYDLQIKMVGGRADCYSWMRKEQMLGIFLSLREQHYNYYFTSRELREWLDRDARDR